MRMDTKKGLEQTKHIDCVAFVVGVSVAVRAC
jgi:hypothetical protein